MNTTDVGRDVKIVIKSQLIMKYIVESLEQKMNIHPIGEVTFEACPEGEGFGYTIIIAGKPTTLIVWWADYATWLEKKLEEKSDTKITGYNK